MLRLQLSSRRVAIFLCRVSHRPQLVQRQGLPQLQPQHQHHSLSSCVRKVTIVPRRMQPVCASRALALFSKPPPTGRSGAASVVVDSDESILGQIRGWRGLFPLLVYGWLLFFGVQAGLSAHRFLKNAPVTRQTAARVLRDEAFLAAFGPIDKARLGTMVWGLIVADEAWLQFTIIRTDAETGERVTARVRSHAQISRDEWVHRSIQVDVHRSAVSGTVQLRLV